MSFITASGKTVGSVGQGTWYLGEHRATFQEEQNALRSGIDAGMTLIDTAEMYGEGAAEKLVGAAIQGYVREDLYLVSKVYPFNAGRLNIYKSCEASLRRMGTDYLDLYLLHWRGMVPSAVRSSLYHSSVARSRRGHIPGLPASAAVLVL